MQMGQVQFHTYLFHEPSGFVGRPRSADWQSAIQQVGNLRYEAGHSEFMVVTRGFNAREG
jgi:hypothetical protein